MTASVCSGGTAIWWTALPLVLSVYDGVPKGGTAQTLAYAMRQGVPVQILDPEQGD